MSPRCRGFKETKNGGKTTPLETPSIYVGETSRSIYERAKEHWGAYQGGTEDSHIRKHQLLVHQGESHNFIMRLVEFHQSALSRQVGEAVLIRRR